MHVISGKAWVFGDNLNTDVIHPPEFFSLDPDRVRAGLFHKLDPQIQPNLEPGDVLVGGHNFGCGSSRETSMRSLKLNQIGAIVAIDFARIFFRNATNNGLPCLVFRNAADKERISAGDRLNLDIERAVLQLPDASEIALEPPGAFIRQIWEAGGLLSMLG